MKRKKKELIIYAFIDSQNLNLGVRSQGWRLDFGRSRQKKERGVALRTSLKDLLLRDKCIVFLF